MVNGWAVCMPPMAESCSLPHRPALFPSERHHRCWEGGTMSSTSVNPYCRCDPCRCTTAVHLRAAEDRGEHQHGLGRHPAGLAAHDDHDLPAGSGRRRREAGRHGAGFGRRSPARRRGGPGRCRRQRGARRGVHPAGLRDNVLRRYAELPDEHGHGPRPSVRSATYKGHRIEILTTCVP